MKWGIIGALDQEIALICDRMENISCHQRFGSTIYEGTLFGQEVVLACCSIGKVNAACCATVLMVEFHADRLINVGIAGAVHRELSLLDVVISQEVVYHDIDSGLYKKYYPFATSFTADPQLVQLCEDACKSLAGRDFNYRVGRIATGDVFVEDEELKQQIIQRTNPCCVEMEGAAIGQAAFICGKPFVVIRSMSDSAGDDASALYENWMERAAEHSAMIVLKMVELSAQPN